MGCQVPQKIAQPLGTGSSQVQRIRLPLQQRLLALKASHKSSQLCSSLSLTAPLESDPLRMKTQLEDLYGWFDYTFNLYLNINGLGHSDFLQSPSTTLRSGYSQSGYSCLRHFWLMPGNVHPACVLEPGTRAVLAYTQCLPQQWSQLKISCYFSRSLRLHTLQQAPRGLLCSRTCGLRGRHKWLPMRDRTNS